MQRLASWIHKLLCGTLVVLLGVMVLLVFGNVVLRYGFNSGLVFSEEVSRFVFMWLTLLGALLALHEGGHLGMTSVVDRLPPAGRRAARLLADLVMLGCCILLAHGTWKQMLLGLSERSPVTGVPMGVVFSGLLICAVGMALLLLRTIVLNLAGRLDVDAAPAGEVRSAE